MAALGADRVNSDSAPIMGSEDFGVFARHVSACFSFLGNGTTEGNGGSPLHSPTYDFNDQALTAGVAFYTEVVRQELARLH